jgi:hypothetical protein
MNSEKTGSEYATKDISNIVGIAPPTVRKYSRALEKAGYSFIKNEKGFRIFVDKDIFVFNEIKRMSKDKAMPIDKIVILIVSNQSQMTQQEEISDILEITQSDSGSSSDIVPYDTGSNQLIEKLAKLDLLDDLVKELQEVREMNKVLMEQTKQQQVFIEKIFLERDKQFVGSLKSSMDHKQLQNQLDEIKESLSEVAVGQEKIKQSFFSRLFSSNKFS